MRIPRLAAVVTDAALQSGPHGNVSFHHPHENTVEGFTPVTKNGGDNESSAIHRVGGFPAQRIIGGGVQFALRPFMCLFHNEAFFQRKPDVSP